MGKEVQKAQSTNQQHELRPTTRSSELHFGMGVATRDIENERGQFEIDKIQFLCRYTWRATCM